jgi:hypothetical protein
MSRGKYDPAGLIAASLLHQENKLPILHSKSWIDVIEPGKVEVVCNLCHDRHQLPITAAQVADWMNGTLAQLAFSHIHPDGRELLISGTCPKCWNRLFGEPEPTGIGDIFSMEQASEPDKTVLILGHWYDEPDGLPILISDDVQALTSAARDLHLFSYDAYWQGIWRDHGEAVVRKEVAGYLAAALESFPEFKKLKAVHG